MVKLLVLYHAFGKSLKMNYDINILIVEDLLTTRLFLRRTLKKLGFMNVVLSEDGEAALKEIEKNLLT